MAIYQSDLEISDPKGMTHLTEDSDQKPKSIKIEECRKFFIVKILLYC